MTTSRLKAGVIGLGILGRQHAEFLHRHPAVALDAVVDVRPAVADQTAAALNATAYYDANDMFNSHRLDLVVIATPDHLHCQPALAALAAGAPNIIQEKPMATTMADAEAIYEAVERTGARFFVNFANRASPMDIATRYVIQQGLLGRVVYGEARLDDNITVPTQMWGDRTREFAGNSSTAHFLLSHVVDLLRWYFAPAEVTEVYAISQQAVLGYTPDLYDAFLTFDSGMKIRVKAEWIKYIDELVEFYLSFSGSEGTLVYNKRGGFGCIDGWRANLAQHVTVEALRQHQDVLFARGVNVAGVVHRPMPSTGQLSAGGGHTALALEQRGPSHAGTMALAGLCIDAILEERREPASYQGNGPLPDHVDGLRQAQIVLAIVDSARMGEPVALG
jgi:predicted dehydrogenase